MIIEGIRSGGVLVYWSLGAYSYRHLLAHGLLSLGEEFERYTPEQRTPQAILKHSLGEMFPGATNLIRPLKTKDGFTVVLEQRGEDNNSYSSTLTAKIKSAPSGGIRIDLQPFDSEQAEQIRQHYQRLARTITGDQVGQMLVQIIAQLGGTSLRPRGGLYWLPEDRVSQWQEITRIVEGAAAGHPNVIYTLRQLLDESTVRAVRDGIVAEISKDAHLLHEEVISGTLGERALLARQQQAEELREKISRYESILSVSLAVLHTAVDQAEQAAATAVMLQSANEEAVHV